MDLLNLNNTKSPRSSNLELYRIICMLMIVAHHYLVNSGLYSLDGPLLMYPNSLKTLFLKFFGMWGKTGINCFLMITGYYMCASKITIRKFVKLLSQIYFYKIVIYFIFLSGGYESLSISRSIKLLMPFYQFSSNFVGCFIAFYLLIPFLNILIHNMNEKQHRMLLCLLLLFYTILGSFPGFKITFNYITWFSIIYFIAAYIRLYPQKIFEKRSLWGCTTLLSMILAMISTCFLHYPLEYDANRFFAVVVAISSFLWFKNMNIKYSKLINAFGAATFGVLLIHANSNAMRTWLWKDTVDVVGHYTLPLGQLVLFSVGVVLAIFLICNLIDQLRIATLEKWFFNWYDRKLSSKVDAFVNRITIDKNVK